MRYYMEVEQMAFCPKDGHDSFDAESDEEALSIATSRAKGWGKLLTVYYSENDSCVEIAPFKG